MSKKKSSTVVLSARELRKLVKTEGIRFRHVADKDIDYSDIPRLTEEQMRQFQPVKRRKSVK